jgi:hypothetical protein
MADQFQLPPGATAVTPDASQDTGSSTTPQQFALPPGATPAQQTSGTPEPTFNGPVAQTLGKIGEGGAEGFGDLWNMVKSTWQTWESMINRCTNPQATGHEHYFDAGVKICDRWLIFENFLADMGERPEGCTLGRFGDIGNYEKSNCGWQTDREQKAEQKTKRQLAFLAA